MTRKTKNNHHSDASSTAIRKTERSAVAVLMHWMREVIQDANLDLGLPDVDTSGSDRKSPDMVIYESRRSNNVLLVMEAKPPHFDVFNEDDLKEPARKKATKRGARYFAVTNFRTLLWYDTTAVNEGKPESDQLFAIYELSAVDSLDNLEAASYREPTQKILKEFIEALFKASTGLERPPRLPLDQILINMLHMKIRHLAVLYRRMIEKHYNEDEKFRKELKHWFVDQGWHFYGQLTDFDKVARQSAYLLVNKILFYNHLQSKRQNRLSPLEVPPTLLWGREARKCLQVYFDTALQIDYETIFTSDFIDELAVPDDREMVREVGSLLKSLARFDLSQLGYDVIGRIFEKLIPRRERRSLGQYFTNTGVIDIILKFCLNHETDMVLDPSCGAGTFLVRAYRQKKLLNQFLEHDQILDTLWGIDIAKFPAHLAVINLAINDLSVDKNYPNIIQEDFFKIQVAGEGFDLPESWRKKRAVTLGIKPKDISYPHKFDVIVGNPPYTRQEQIPEIGVDKSELIANALKNYNGKSLATISKRAGIYAYFFVHGTKMLKDGGRFGFVTANAWLDVDYGKGLQEFMLNNYKIITIIESKVERWFEEADVNTCIVILEKCSDQKIRDENLVRFVYLKKPLDYFLPEINESWEEEVERSKALHKLHQTILAYQTIYENEDFRIYPILQKTLWEEGYDSEGKVYQGGKWGKYLRAPDVFFYLLRKCERKLIQLKDMAEVRFGIKTGSNDYFYLTEEDIFRKQLEEESWGSTNDAGEFTPNYVLRSFKETAGISVAIDQLRWRILLINKTKKELKRTNTLQYIKHGETREFGGKVPAETATCRGRGDMWYSLGGNQRSKIFYPRRIGDRFLIPFSDSPIYCSDNLFPVTLKDSELVKPLAAYLNSPIMALFHEIMGRKLTGSINVVDMDVWMANNIPVPEFSKVKKSILNRLKVAFDNLCSLSVENTLVEYCQGDPDVVSLEKIRPERRELDKIIMGEILGLTDEEQLDIYRAVVDLVRSRVIKSESVQNNHAIKDGIDVEAFVEVVKERIGEETIGSFYRKRVFPRVEAREVTLPPTTNQIHISQGLFGWRLHSGSQFVDCQSEMEARFLKVLLSYGFDEVKVPTDESYLSVILPQLEELDERINSIIESYLEPITNARVRDSLKRRIHSEIIQFTS